MRIFLTAVVAMWVLGACTPLTSEHPLFAHANEAGPLPLTQGVWVPLEDHCTRQMAMATPIAETCDQLTLHHGADGWRLSGRDKDNDRDVEIPFVLVPAVRTETDEAYAPLYVAQFSMCDADRNCDAAADERIYTAIAPIGTLPATEAYVTSIDCAAILREGPLDGVAERRNPDGSLSGCSAANPAAVREAARRAIIQELSNIDRDRMIFVHP